MSDPVSAQFARLNPLDGRAPRTQPVVSAEARLDSRFARRVRFPMGRESPQGAVMAEDGLSSNREKCTCRVAVRFPDERSEELSQRESRKRVRVATAKQQFDRAVGTAGAPFSKYKNSSFFQRNKIAPRRRYPLEELAHYWQRSEISVNNTNSHHILILS